jgi:hypothetical protein
MRLQVLGLLTAAVLGYASDCFAEPCAGGAEQPVVAGKSIVLVDDTLVFRTGSLELDIDGSPDAYGARDQGLEDICNGLGPLEPPRCRGKNQGECYGHCRTAFRHWDGKPETLGSLMCSIGLGGGGCSEPEVRLQPSPRQDWFVSETAVHSAHPSGVAPAGWVRSQAAQLDTSQIAYFVIPARLRRLPWDATPGDAGVVIDRRTGRQATFIIGDTGGALDEGSARLLAHLRGLATLPLRKKTNAFGEEVRRLVGAVEGDFAVGIFRHTAKLNRSSSSLLLDLTADQINAWAETTAQGRLAALGGPDQLVACADQSS